MSNHGSLRRPLGRPGSTWISLLTILSLVTGLLLVFPAPARAASYTVNSSADAVNASANGACDVVVSGSTVCTLREALMEANANPGYDTIVLPPGTYTLTITGSEGNNTGTNVLEEDLDITDGVRIVGGNGDRESDPASTIIQASSTPGGNPFRVFHIKTSASSGSRTVTFEAVTIRHGWSGDLAYGGGIFYDPVDGDGTLHLYNSVVTLNRAAYDGGGIMLSSDTGGTYTGLLAIVEKSEISYNAAGSDANGNRSANGGGIGGGITAGAVVPLQVKQSRISYNTAYDSNCTNCYTGGDGGGIYFWDNAHTDADGLSYVEDSIISYNTADDDVNSAGRGGGMYVGRPLKVRNSSVIGNHADFDGGGLYHSAIAGDFHYLANLTISGNTAAKDGAGLMMTPSTTGEIHLVNVTVTNNRSDHNDDGTGSGGGIYRTDDGILKLYNSIVGGNYKGSSGTTASDVGYLSAALHSSSSHNVIGTGGSGGLTHGSNNNQVGLTTAQIGLGPLADNGSAVPASHVGARLTHALLGGSAALDAGSNTYVDESTYGGPYTTDGRGTNFARKLDAGDSEDTADEVDAGALEMHPAIGEIVNASIIQDPPAAYSTTFHVGDGDLVLNPTAAVTVQSQSVTGLITGTSGSVSGSTGTLTATIGAGKYGTATLRVKVDDTYNGVLQEMYEEFVLTVVPRPDLTVTKSHTDPWRQGDQDRPYTISVQNVGPGSTLLPGDPLLPDATYVTITDTLPTGLTPASPTAWAGSNWNCTVVGQTYTCEYSQAIAAGGSASPLTLYVDVADDAAATVTNSVSVSGGGDNTAGNNADDDLTNITQTADLTISKSHTDPFQQGQSGATYSLVVSNIGPGPTDAPITVADTLPVGIEPTAASGTDWSCTINGQDLSCTRSAVLTNVEPDNTSTISITANVATDAATTSPHQLTNTASVSGGGELASRSGNNAASDVTTITQMPDLTISKSPVGNFREGRTAQYTLTVTNAGYADTSGTITVTDTLPVGMTPTAAVGTDWSCDVTGQEVSCTRTAAMAPSATSEITIDLTVADDTSTSLTNTASVSGGGQIYTANDAGSHTTSIEQTSDLTVAKSHTGAFTQGQTGATYTITVTNAGAGPTDAAVTVTDTLPTGLTATAISGTGWSCDLATLTCTRSDVLAASNSYPAITLTVDVDAYAPPSLTNTVTVSGGGEIDTTNNTADDPTNITQLPDLTITKSHTGDFYQGQTDASYTLTVTNSGTGLTSGTVTVTDTLPAGLTATAISGTGWSCALATLTCTRSDVLAAGDSYEVITITVTVAVDAAASVTNTASVSGGGDTDTANNTASDPTTILSKPDLTVTKSANGTFRQGQPASFTLTVNNAGNQPADGSTVTLTDTLDSAFTPGAITTDTAVWNCSVVGQVLTCTSTAVVDGGVSFAAVTVNVTVANDAATSVDNTASVSGGGEANTTNNSATIAVPVAQAPDLTITKSHTGAFTQGQTGAAFTITVSNLGPGETFGAVTVTDTLPAGLTATAISGAGWSCARATLTCTRSDTLAAGSSYPAITLTVDVAATAPPSLTNSVTVSGGSDLTPGNNTATDAVTVIQLPDLTITKSHTGDFHQGQTGAGYTITVTNSGTGLTSGTVTVTDTLPAGLTVTAISGTGWSCHLATLTCTRSDLLAGGASYDAITLTVDVSITAAGSVTNTATVSGGNDVNNANNTASDPTNITPRPNLTVAKSHTGNFQQGQQGASYTITVSNAGSAATSGTATVTDTLPVGLTPVSAGGTGWTCTIDGQSVTCTSAGAVDPGNSYPAITLTVDVAQDAALSLTNEATVAGGGEVYTGDNTTADPTTVDPTPDLTITKSHAEPFRQGLSHSYTITVSNSGSAPTTGTVTVADTLPAGLTANAISGTGWICDLATLTCSRSDTLAAGSSYPAITLAVEVAANAPPSVTNTATVSGGGELTTTNNTAEDPTTIVQVADLTVTKSHSDPMVTGLNELYTITVSNTGLGPTDAPVTVTDTLPTGLTPLALTGDGWSCDLATLTCTRSDALAPGAAYPPIYLTVEVTPDAEDTSINQVQVSGGGQSNLTNDADDDPGKVVPPEPPGPPDWVQLSVAANITRESQTLVSG
ncbi:MAG: beta strand repeat-containing protein [Bacillota bacterium]